MLSHSTEQHTERGIKSRLSIKIYLLPVPQTASMLFRTSTSILQCNAYAVLQPMSQNCFRKEGALKEGLWELSNKEFSILGMFFKYRNNFAFLSRAAEAIGKQYESRSYNELRGCAADESRGEYVFEELRISYSAYSYNIKRNGGVC
jgi:hypothetical protein